MIYRIVTNKGHVDTAFDLELAEHKFKMYVKDMDEGYLNFVKMTQQSGMYGKEEEIKKEIKKNGI